MKALRGVGFSKYALSITIYNVWLSENGYVKNPVSLSKNIFSASIFVMHIVSMSETYLQSVKKDPVKALTCVDFAKYALSIIIYYVQVSENG